MGISRISRYISRRYIGLLKYIIAIGCFYVVYGLFFSPGISRGNEARALGRGDRIHVDGDVPHVNPASADTVDPFLKYRGKRKINWEDVEAYKADQARVGPGEQGKPVQLPKDPMVEKEALALYKANGYNAYISDMIPLNRSIKDIRHPQCKNMEYNSELPSVSVIFPFHEEHNSTLLRSVYSIINRSPKQLLKEIILVDDFSEKPFLKKPLEDLLKRNHLDDLVKVVRTKAREGLIRARLLGAEKATGDVLIFLDAHSEANYNWLPPLLDPIVEDYRTVVCPFVDVIDCETYEIRPQDEGARGSFDWSFNYKRLPLTRKDRENPTKPFPSPVMAGGYFAISTKWFWELGGYDEGLDIWGGEQYELSFKVWQCHGRMVDAPCSRVGHIYRCKYSPFKSANKGDFISRNYKRVAEVWMDDYKHHLYKHRHGVGNADPGDLTKQLAVRERLKCKSFDWFMKEVAFDQDKYYPAVEPKPSASGELRNKGTNLCVDTEFKQANQRFGLRKCISDDPDGGGEQNLRITRWHDIRPEGRAVCFDASTSDDKAPVVLFDCHSMKGNQLFKYRIESQMIYHPISNQCLSVEPDGSGYVFMQQCDPDSPTQKWTWQIALALKIFYKFLEKKVIIHSMKGNQLFKYRIESQMIYHPISNQCLSVEPDGSGYVFMQQCDPESPTQKWTWQVLDKKLLEERQNAEPNEED
ncbi:glycosyltransferase, group 2 family protein [Oesophagostomum dentatum]|uniref:Polypeptide N-acetylgalactosaminyltransferase n=1 Tax=Oesophagostomum dentatum TaxID=61180 RepID=A0A0B1TP38_OESDE|nr:glycosyltransferase, group 2 family protein [Oesophagostomum dentatum]